MLVGLLRGRTASGSRVAGFSERPRSTAELMTFAHCRRFSSVSPMCAQPQLCAASFISLAISSVVASTVCLTIFDARVTALSKPFSRVGCPITIKPI